MTPIAPNSTRRVRKAVFPVAGLGTRFLPATKTVPKEMLPIIDKPLIQYAVDEAIEAGCIVALLLASVLVLAIFLVLLARMARIG